MGVMTYNALKHLGSYRRFYTIGFQNLKNQLNGVLAEVMPSFGYYSKCVFTFTKWAHVIPKCEVYLLSC
jgi:hypothetical protein